MIVRLEPTLRLHDGEHAFIGEQVLFSVGLRTSEPVDAMRFVERGGRLTVRAPDGTTVEESFEAPSSYDGPSQIRALSRPLCLNDLCPAQPAGVYELGYAFDGQEATARVELRPLEALDRVAVALELPEHVELAVHSSVAATIRVANQGAAPLELVVPGSIWGAAAAGYLESDDPPLWLSLRPLNVPQRVPERVQRLLPGEHLSVPTALASGLGEGVLYSDPRWMPRSGFRITFGVVAYVRLEGIERRLRRLARIRVGYDRDGRLGRDRSDGPFPRWAMVVPYMEQ
jgi:hypothetical protein